MFYIIGYCSMAQRASCPLGPAAIGGRQSVGIAEKSMSGNSCPTHWKYFDGPGPNSSVYFLISNRSLTLLFNLPPFGRVSPRHGKATKDLKMNV